MASNRPDAQYIGVRKKPEKSIKFAANSENLRRTYDMYREMHPGQQNLFQRT